VLPGARGGLATCDLPIGSFLGQPKCAQARCFGCFGLPLGVVEPHDYPLRFFCHLERILGAATALSAAQLGVTTNRENNL
jgi:hypothetical protein